jgi:hypothetical protein
VNILEVKKREERREERRVVCIDVEKIVGLYC